MAKKPKELPQPELENQPYKVGYGRPPLKTRFQPGVSPNPNGRPKGARSLATDLKEELNERVEIREGGKVRRMTKQRAFIKNTVHNGIKSVGRAPDTVLKMMDRAGIPFEDASDNPVTEDDALLVQMLVDRHLRRQALKAAEGEADTPSEDRAKKSLKKPGRKG